MAECLKHECSHRETWYAKAQQTEIDELKAHVERFRNALDYGSRHIGLTATDCVRQMLETPQQSLVAIKKAERERCAVACKDVTTENVGVLPTVIRTRSACAQAIMELEDE